MKFVIAFSVLIAICAVAPVECDRSAIIVRDSRSSDGIGNYKFDFQTSNGIVREEVGEVSESPENIGVVVRGSASWISPEGTPIELKFTADENGYHPTV